jgi:hypothetical protein
MAILTAVSRLADYYRRQGLRATIRRGALAVRLGLFTNRMVVFYCELAKQTLLADLPKSLEVERLRSHAELTPHDLHQIIQVWNPKLAQRNIEERFGKGASLWLIKVEDRLAGYGWTLQGRTIAPYYFPLAEDDVHLFDFYVFPPFRGRGINPSLVTYILRSLAVGLGGRAFIEAAEWNQAQLSSLLRTPFGLLGWARQVTIFGNTFVCWAGDAMVGQLRQTTDRAGRDRPEHA